MKFYVAAPMSGHVHWNIPAIDEAAATLRDLGHEVMSPAELDDASFRKVAFASARPLSPTDHPTRETWADLLARDIKVVADWADAVVVLPGWQRSRGARLETFMAFICGKPTLHYPSLHPVRKMALIKAWLGDAAYQVRRSPHE